VLVEVVRSTVVDMRQRAEATDAGHGHVESALAAPDDLPLDRLSRVSGHAELLLEAHLDRESARDPNLVAVRHHHDLDGVARAELIELVPAEHSFGLATDVNQDHVAVDGSDSTFDNVSDPDVFGSQAPLEGQFELTETVGILTHGRPRRLDSAPRSCGGRVG